MTHSPLRQVQQAANRLQAVSVRHDKARSELRQAVLKARENHSLAEIGKVLGVTRQAVHGLLKGHQK